MKIIITILSLFTYFSSSAQTKVWKDTNFKLSSLKNSGRTKVWELLPMDSTHVYYISVKLNNKPAAKKEKKIFARIIRMAKWHKPKDIYLIFEKRKKYPIDYAQGNNSEYKSFLVIQEQPLSSYLEMVCKFNPPVKKELLRKKCLLLKVKEPKKYDIQDN